MHRSIIIGSGAYIPENVIRNSDFLSHKFYLENSVPEENASARIIEKFVKITGIYERRYATEGLSASDMAAKAADLAIADSGIEK